MTAWKLGLWGAAAARLAWAWPGIVVPWAVTGEADVVEQHVTLGEVAGLALGLPGPAQTRGRCRHEDPMAR